MKPHPKPQHPGALTSRWSRALLAAVPVALLSALAYAAAPLADTRIGNVATATYTDASNTERSATSNAVTTIVQQVSAFTLEQTQEKNAAPGGQVYFPHTLANTGNGADSFTLSVTQNASAFSLTNLAIYADADGNGLPDDVTPIADSGPVAAGGVFKFVAVGIVPGSATAGQTSSATVTAAGTATGTPAAAITNIDTVRVTNNAVIDVFKAVSSASGTAGSGPHFFTLTYTNNGNSTATGVTITDAIPAGMTYIPSSSLPNGGGRWSVTGAAVLSDASDGTQGIGAETIDYSVSGGTVTAVISQVLPGDSRTITLPVTINAAQGAGTIRNTANYTYDPDGPGGGGPVGPYPTNTIIFTVTQTAGVSVADDSEASAGQGSTVVFQNPVQNLGNGADTFNITVAPGNFPAGTSFQLFKPDGQTPLSDTNNDNIPDTGSLNSSAIYGLVVKAVLPPGAAGGPFSAVVTGTSTVDPAVSDPGTDTLGSITANAVDLTNNVVNGPGTGAGPEAAPVNTPIPTANPGSTTSITLVVKNISSSSDSFDLSVDQSIPGGTLPAGWAVTFRNSGGGSITNTGAIPGNNGSVTVTAQVFIPAGQGPEPTDGVFDLYFRALSPTTGAGDRIHDGITVNTIRALTIAGSGSGQVAPNSSIVYPHTLTNNGNVLEGDASVSSVALTTVNSAAGWSSIVHFDANGNGVIDATDPVVTNTVFSAGLSPGESVTLLVKVTSPPGAPINSQNVTTLSATTTNGSYTTTVPAVATATDTTTVINGDVTLLKEQALDAGPPGNPAGVPDGNPDTAYSNVNITAGARPGESIRYRITVTNKGTAAATNVKVFDTTPAYTTYTTTGPATVTGGSVPGVTTVPGNNAAGALEFNVGTLNPGESAVVTFGVDIDE